MSMGTSPFTGTTPEQQRDSTESSFTPPAPQGFLWYPGVPLNYHHCQYPPMVPHGYQGAHGAAAVPHEQSQHPLFRWHLGFYGTHGSGNPGSNGLPGQPQLLNPAIHDSQAYFTMPSTLTGHALPPHGPGFVPGAPPGHIPHVAHGMVMAPYAGAVSHGMYPPQWSLIRPSAPPPLGFSPFHPGFVGSFPASQGNPPEATAQPPPAKRQRPDSLSHATMHQQPQMAPALKSVSFSDSGTTTPALEGCLPGAFPQPLNPQTFDPLAAWYRYHYAPKPEQTEEVVDSSARVGQPRKASKLQSASDPPVSWNNSKMGLMRGINFQPVRHPADCWASVPAAEQPSISGAILETAGATIQDATRSTAPVKWWMDMKQCFGPAIVGAREMHHRGECSLDSEAMVHVDAAAGSNLTGGGITMVGSCDSYGEEQQDMSEKPARRRCAKTRRAHKDLIEEQQCCSSLAPEDSSGGSRCSSPPKSLAEHAELDDGSSSPR